MARKNLTVEKGAIPPEFGKEKTTILFIKARGGYNGYLRRNVRKNYYGAYELVTRAEYENNAKYQDITTYRYVFDFDYNRVNDRYIAPSMATMTNRSVPGNIRPALYQVKKFSIYDRKTDSLYRSPMTSSYWSKLQKVYLRQLEAKRQLEQKQD